MAKHLTYLDIPISRRRQTAGKAASRLKESLGNPALTTEQVDAVRNKLDRLNKWASGTLPQTNHVVSLQETVSVEEG